MAIEDYFQPMTRKVITHLKNAYYVDTKTYTTSTINGYIGSRTDLEQATAGKNTVKSQLRFFADTKCNYGDLIVFDNETFRIISKMQNTVNLSHHYKGYVENISGVD